MRIARLFGMIHRQIYNYSVTTRPVAHRRPGPCGQGLTEGGQLCPAMLTWVSEARPTRRGFGAIIRGLLEDATAPRW